MTPNKLILSTQILIGYFALIHGASVYPAKYPFENERTAPPTLPIFGKPFDNANYKSKDNPGGHIAQLQTCDPYSDDRAAFVDPDLSKQIAAEWLAIKPAGFFECRPVAYFLRGRNLPSVSITSANCTSSTKAGKLGSPSELDNVLEGKTWCNSGTCCETFVGKFLPNYARWLKPAKTQLSERYKGGSCTTLPSEANICWYNSMMHECIEHFIGGKTSNARALTAPCYDNMFIWYMSCPLYKSSSTLRENFGFTNWEPAHYIEKLSNTQIALLENIFMSPDRVCHPYSYYNPSAGGDSSAFVGSMTVVTALVSIVVHAFI